MVTTALMLVPTASANAAETVEVSAGSTVSSAQHESGEAEAAFEQQVAALADAFAQAIETLEAGESRRIHIGDADVKVTKSEDGSLAVVPTPSEAESGGIVAYASVCHAAAMAAVYTIGAAVLAGLALTGGATIAGVFLAPSILNAMSIALAGGGGVSALVAVYIC